jgi:uncharacterized protein (TIRG00374 family)
MPATAPNPARPARRRSYATVAWSVVLSLVAIAAIGVWTNFDMGALRQMARTLDPLLFSAGLSMVVLRILFGAWRLQHVSGGQLGFATSLRGQLSWDFFSNITPSAIGGGPFAALYLAKDSRLKVGDTSAFLLLSMLLDQFWTALSVFAVLVGAFYGLSFPDSVGQAGMITLLCYFGGMLTWTVLFAYAMLVKPEWLEGFITRLFRLRWLSRFEARAQREVKQLRERAILFRTHGWGFYTVGFLLTAGGWIARYLLLVFMVWSVYPALDKDLFFLRSMAMTLGSLIMPTPGAAGGVEGFYALFLGPLMPAALIAPTLLAWRVFGYYVFIAFGGYLSWHRMGQVRRRRSALRDERALNRALRQAASGDGQPSGDGHIGTPMVSDAPPTRR